MEAYLNDKFDAFENHQNAEELERNIYGNCKKKDQRKTLAFVDLQVCFISIQYLCLNWYLLLQHYSCLLLQKS